MNSLQVFISFISFVIGILIGKLFFNYYMIKPILIEIDEDATLVVKKYLMNSDYTDYFSRLNNKKEYHKRLEKLLNIYEINVFWWYLYKITNMKLF
jgi:hypothetical protein